MESNIHFGKCLKEPIGNRPFLERVPHIDSTEMKINALETNCFNFLKKLFVKIFYKFTFKNFLKILFF